MSWNTRKKKCTAPNPRWEFYRAHTDAISLKDYYTRRLRKTCAKNPLLTRSPSSKKGTCGGNRHIFYRDSDYQSTAKIAGCITRNLNKNLVLKFLRWWYKRLVKCMRRKTLNLVFSGHRFITVLPNWTLVQLCRICVYLRVKTQETYLIGFKVGIRNRTQIGDINPTFLWYIITNDIYESPIWNLTSCTYMCHEKWSQFHNFTISESNYMGKSSLANVDFWIISSFNDF